MWGQILLGVLPLALKLVSYFIDKAQMQKESRMAFLLLSQELQKTFGQKSVRFGDSFREATEEIERKKQEALELIKAHNQPAPQVPIIHP